LLQNELVFRSSLAFLNTSLGIFLLSGIFLSGATAAYSSFAEAKRAKRAQEEIMRRLRIELSYRASVLPLLDRDVFSFTDLNTVKGALTGRNPRREGIGELGEFWPIFTEFEGRTLYSLLWEAEKSSLSSNHLEFEELRSHVLPLTRIVNPPRLKMEQPAGDDDSQWSLQTHRQSDIHHSFELLKQQFLEMAVSPTRRGWTTARLLSMPYFQ